MPEMRRAFGEHTPAEQNERVRQIDSVSWAVFFIWIGVALLLDLPWGSTLLGIGALILVTEFARWQVGARVEGFWLVCGALFLAGGLWKILELPWPLTPILIILLGVVLLGSTVMRARG
jgi:hypothetical protein